MGFFQIDTGGENLFGSRMDSEVIGKLDAD
jgi:hypothetical protein